MTDTGDTPREKLDLAVERVRAAALEMRVTDDLRQVVAVVFREMVDLGIETTSATITFFDRPVDSVFHYVANFCPNHADVDWSPDRASGEVVFLGDVYAVGLPTMTQADFLRGANALDGQIVLPDLATWDVGIPQTFETNTVPGGSSRTLEFLGLYLGLTEAESRMLLPPLAGRWSVTNVPFRSGMIGYRERQHSPEHDEIVAELARGIELGFVRFLDFRRLEQQNRELTVQNALERVRARALTMRETEEILEVASAVYQEFEGLGHEIGFAGVGIFDRNGFEYWGAKKVDTDEADRPEWGFLAGPWVSLERWRQALGH